VATIPLIHRRGIFSFFGFADIDRFAIRDARLTFELSGDFAV
jgi:hypothetical protein